MCSGNEIFNKQPFLTCIIWAPLKGAADGQGLSAGLAGLWDGALGQMPPRTSGSSHGAHGEATTRAAASRRAQLPSGRPSPSPVFGGILPPRLFFCFARDQRQRE